MASSTPRPGKGPVFPTRVDLGFQLGGFYLYKRTRSTCENFEAMPTFRAYSTIATDTGCKSQLYAKVSENMSLLASIFVREGVLQVKSQC